MNFKQWQDSIKDIELEQVMVNRNTQRISYTILNNVVLCQDITIPYNFLKKQYEDTFVCLQIPFTKENIDLVKSFDGKLIEGELYASEGFGGAFFHSNEIDKSLENAYNFTIAFNEKGKENV